MKFFYFLLFILWLIIPFSSTRFQRTFMSI